MHLTAYLDSITSCESILLVCSICLFSYNVLIDMSEKLKKCYVLGVNGKLDEYCY